MRREQVLGAFKPGPRVAHSRVSMHALSLAAVLAKALSAPGFYKGRRKVERYEDVRQTSLSLTGH